MHVDRHQGASRNENCMQMVQNTGHQLLLAPTIISGAQGPLSSAGGGTWIEYAFSSQLSFIAVAPF